MHFWYDEFNVMKRIYKALIWCVSCWYMREVFQRLHQRLIVNLFALRRLTGRYFSVSVGVFFAKRAAVVGKEKRVSRGRGNFDELARVCWDSTPDGLSFALLRLLCQILTCNLYPEELNLPTLKLQIASMRHWRHDDLACISLAFRILFLLNFLSKSSRELWPVNKCHWSCSSRFFETSVR